MKNMKDVEETSQVHPDRIAGFIVERSLTGRWLFDIHAVDRYGDKLFCAASDLDFDKATAWVDAINEEHYPYVPTPTETTFVEIGGIKKVYNITAK